jgi:hypothetical protein
MGPRSGQDHLDKRKFSFLYRDSNLTVQPVALSLHRLSYPGSVTCENRSSRYSNWLLVDNVFIYCGL